MQIVLNSFALAERYPSPKDLLLPQCSGSGRSFIYDAHSIETLKTQDFQNLDPQLMAPTLTEEVPSKCQDLGQTLADKLVFGHFLV